MKYHSELHLEGETVTSIDLEFSFHSWPVRTEGNSSTVCGVYKYR